MWICKNCKEEHQDDFDTCWKCQEISDKKDEVPQLEIEDLSFHEAEMLGVLDKEEEKKDEIAFTHNGSWWKYDDEYITGWQYFGRSLVGALLSIIIVGFYLQSVTAYKRAKSLGNSSSACNFFSVWGALSMFIGLIPGVNLINIIPHWYLWFSNGLNPKRIYRRIKDEKNQEHRSKSDRITEGIVMILCGIFSLLWIWGILGIVLIIGGFILIFKKRYL